MHLFSFLLPFAIELIRSYIRNTDSKKDDLVLDVVKDGLFYLSDKDNNNVSIHDARAVNVRTVISSKNKNKKGGL